MKLISCDGCGVVLDQDKLLFADDMYDEDGCINEAVADYRQETGRYELYVSCAFCLKPVFKQ